MKWTVVKETWHAALCRMACSDDRMLLALSTRGWRDRVWALRSTRGIAKTLLGGVVCVREMVSRPCWQIWKEAGGEAKVCRNRESLNMRWQRRIVGFAESEFAAWVRVLMDEWRFEVARQDKRA